MRNDAELVLEIILVTAFCVCVMSFGFHLGIEVGAREKQADAPRTCERCGAPENRDGDSTDKEVRSD